MNSYWLVYALCFPNVLGQRTFSLLPGFLGKHLWEFLASCTQDSAAQAAYLLLDSSFSSFLPWPKSTDSWIFLKHWGSQAVTGTLVMCGQLLRLQATHLTLLLWSETTHVLPWTHRKNTRHRCDFSFLVFIQTHGTTYMVTWTSLKTIVRTDDISLSLHPPLKSGGDSSFQLITIPNRAPIFCAIAEALFP